MLKAIIICLLVLILIPVLCIIIALILLELGLSAKFDDDKYEMRESLKNKDIPLGKRVIWWLSSYL